MNNAGSAAQRGNVEPRVMRAQSYLRGPEFQSELPDSEPLAVHPRRSYLNSFGPDSTMGYWNSP